MTPSTIRPLRGALIGICLLVAAGANLSSTERESSRRPSRLASLRTTRHARLSTVIRPLRRKRAAAGSSDVSALARSAGDACSASSDRCRSRTRAGASLIRVETAAVPGAGKEAARKRKRAVFPLAETMIEEAVNGRQRGAGLMGGGTRSNRQSSESGDTGRAAYPKQPKCRCRSPMRNSPIQVAAGGAFLTGRPVIRGVLKGTPRCCP